MKGASAAAAAASPPFVSATLRTTCLFGKYLFRVQDYEGRQNSVK